MFFQTLTRSNMEKEIVNINGTEYKLFHIEVNGEPMCVGEQKLNDHILDCLENNTYTGKLVAVDERIPYFVEQEIADTENEEAIVKHILELIESN